MGCSLRWRLIELALNLSPPEKRIKNKGRFINNDSARVKKMRARVFSMQKRTPDAPAALWAIIMAGGALFATKCLAPENHPAEKNSSNQGFLFKI